MAVGGCRASARAIHGGYQRFTLLFVSTVVLILNEFRMSVIPDGPLFQENHNNGLVIQFHELRRWTGAYLQGSIQ